MQALQVPTYAIFVGPSHYNDRMDKNKIKSTASQIWHKHTNLLVLVINIQKTKGNEINYVAVSDE